MSISTFRTLTIGLASAGALLLTLGDVQAAPQALALVATKGEVPLHCENGVCKAEFSTFCLQPDRHTPVRGTRYFMVEGANLELVGRDATGRKITLPASENLDFHSKRTHVALEISLPQARLHKLGLKDVTISVGRNVSLVPEAQADDPRPMTEGDLAMAGRLRTLGAKLIDRNKDHMVAAHMTSRMINALPPSGARTTDDNDAILQAAVKAGGGQISPRADELARRAVRFCEFAAENRTLYGGMRRCLQKEHDNMLDILNSRYWDAVKTGS